MARREELHLHDRARRALADGRPDEALQLIGALLGHVHVVEGGLYESWLELALAAYLSMGRSREAGCILIALGRWAEAQRLLDEQLYPLDWALCAAKQNQHAAAAAAYARVGRHGLAALELRAAHDEAGACSAWRAALADSRLQGRKYETALLRFSLGESLLGLHDEAAARREMAVAQRLLEELADEFESAGERERAFDCYGVLLQLGRETGSFENVAEGYLSSIRILAADDRRTYVLQYYEDFIAYAVERGESHAAATLAREAASFCLRSALAHDGYYLQRAADLWLEASRHNQEAGGPVDLTESALLSGIEAASALGDLAALTQFYERLSELPLDEKRRLRYRRLAARYSSLPAVRPRVVPFPDYLRQPDAYQDIWRQDVIEWELGGEASAVLTRIIAEGKYNVRFGREALRALLLAARVDGAPNGVGLQAELAIALGRVGVYEVLRPLELLLELPTPEVRAAVMTGVAKVFCIRSFSLVRRGLADAHDLVRSEALRALRGLKFRDGLDCLARIFRDSKDPAIRTAALDTIADIGVVGGSEAVTLLVDALREDDPELRALAEARLAAMGTAGDRMREDVLIERYQVEVGPAREALARILAQHSAM